MTASKVWLSVACFAAGILAGGPSSAGEDGILVERYVAVTIQRLRAAAVTVERERRPMRADEEEALLATAGMTRETYYGFAGANGDALSAHLAAHPAEREEIEALSARVRAAVERLDAAPAGVISR